MADSRAVAEDAAELVDVAYEPLSPIVDPEAALDAGVAARPSRSRHQPALSPDLRVGAGRGGFRRFAASRRLSRALAPQRHGADRDVRRGGALGSGDAAPRRLGLDPDAEILRSARPRAAPAGQCACAPISTSMSAAATAASAASSTACLRAISRAGSMRRCGSIEDRLENLRGGDAHGPDRIFDVELAFDGEGHVRAMKMRALDDVGAYAGRAPFQLGKPIGAIVGPYRFHSVSYEPVSVLTNKTPQEAVRGFGQSPTNFAIETGMDLVARRLGIDRIELRRRNLIRARRIPLHHSRAAAPMTAATTRPCSTRRSPPPITTRWCGGATRRARRDGSPASAFPAAWSRAAATRRSSRCSIPRTRPRPGWRGARSGSMGPAPSLPRSEPRARGRDTRRWLATVVGEILERDPDTVRVVRSDSLAALPSNSPVGQPHGDHAGRGGRGSRAQAQGDDAGDRRA